MFLEIALLAVVSFKVDGSSPTSSSKRGLDFIPDADYPSDDSIWTRPGTDLTWYYNYGFVPSPSFANDSQSKFEFVPMMWGTNSSNLSSTSFLTSVRSLVAAGTKIEHVLGFNEPDESTDDGGSDISPEDAATAWVANFEPLTGMGLKLGLPATTGTDSGLSWLKQFLDSCSTLVSSSGGNDHKKNCSWDFLPVHWYGDFAGLQSYVSLVSSSFETA